MSAQVPAERDEETGGGERPSGENLVLRHIIGWPLLVWSVLGWLVLIVGALAGRLPQSVPPSPREQLSITIAVLFPLLPWLVGYLLLRRVVNVKTLAWRAFRAGWFLCAAAAVLAALMLATSH